VQSSGTHRCKDCFGPNFWCSACCVSAHKNLPFHRIQMWNGRFFEHSELLTDKHIIDLCHYPDDCPTIPLNVDVQMMHDQDLSDDGGDDECADRTSEPSGLSQRFRSQLIIVSSTGIFKRSIRWCHCIKSSDQYVELLLRAKLFPASFKNPKTAFTFEVLDHFRIDALECKTSAMNFMSKIGQITNEAFPSQVPVCIMLCRMRFACLLSDSRTDIGSYSESLDSGGTFTITLELALFMIGQIFLSMAVWHCSVLLVRRRI